MDKLSYRMLYIGGAPAGLIGLEELFAKLFEAGMTPGDATFGDELIKGIRQHNFVPKPAVDEYLVVLKREYAKYYKGRSGGKATVAKNYGTWQGHPRETIPWFPTISSELCNGCGACLELCAHNVYERDENGKVIVVDPFSCIVGCCFCKSVCNPKALLFPSQELLNNYRPKA
jgi:NAD-dependent dihydropyrimidine dehydrogenase PreA subunit